MDDKFKDVFYNVPNWHAILNDHFRQMEREEFLKSYDGLTVEEKVDKLIKGFADFRFSTR